MTGLPVALGPRAALSFSLIVHELLTNACKYGALTNDYGKVSLSWGVEDSQDGDLLKIEWREQGGPPVVPPTRKGLRLKANQHWFGRYWWRRSSLRSRRPRGGPACLYAPVGPGLMEYVCGMSKPVVLVVEDEPLLRLFASDMIEEAGFEVLEASNASAALVALEERRDIRVVFTDVDMPGGIDGIMLAIRIRNKWPTFRS
jgi:Signal transduction histidine kinase